MLSKAEQERSSCTAQGCALWPYGPTELRSCSALLSTQSRVALRAYGPTELRTCSALLSTQSRANRSRTSFGGPKGPRFARRAVTNRRFVRAAEAFVQALLSAFISNNGVKLSTGLRPRAFVQAGTGRRRGFLLLAFGQEHAGRRSCCPEPARPPAGLRQPNVGAARAQLLAQRSYFA